MMIVGRNGVSRKWIFWARYWRYVHAKTRSGGLPASGCYSIDHQVITTLGNKLIANGGDEDGKISSALTALNRPRPAEAYLDQE